MSEQNTIESISIEGQLYEIDAKLWGGKEINDIKTVNNTSLFGSGNIDVMPNIASCSVYDLDTTTTPFNRIYFSINNTGVMSEYIVHTMDCDVYRKQIAYDCTANNIYTRFYQDPSWTSWIKVPTDLKTINGQSLLGSGDISISSTSTQSIIDITYYNLKMARDNGGLIPGQQYRITDYITTTTQENTQSVGNVFDIIVTANSDVALNEVARACLNENDNYFSRLGANLDAWQIWYCLDNDINRFSWADTNNGKGVIYRMIDEYNNDCPYDFKNIQFKRNINGTDRWCYTFTWVNESDEIQDVSIVSSSLKLGDNKYYATHDNIIRLLSSVEVDTSDVTQFAVSLNDIVFISKHSDSQSGDFYGIFNNTFGVNNYNFTFGNNCSCNTFGNDCYNNTFGANCYYNIFANMCCGNTFGSNLQYNTFGNECYANSFTGSSLKYSVFAGNISGNTIGSEAGHIQNICVLNGTKNTNLTNYITSNCSNTQICGFNSNNEIKVNNVLDEVEIDENYPIVKRSDGTATVKPNTYNIWNTNAYPTKITLETPADSNIVNEYVIRFTIPSSLSSYSLSFTSAVKWVDNNTPIWQAGCTYEISIVDGYAVFFKYN